MAEEERTVADDIAWIDQQLADPEASFDELRKDHPFLRSASQARRFLEETREGLVSIETGELYTTEQVIKALDERRRARPAA